MNVFRKGCTICATAAAAAGFMCPAFAQDVEEQTVSDSGLQRTADIVNLMRGIFAPDPAPVLASPAERAVSVRQAGTSADSRSSVVTTIPVVTMPDIVLPDSEAEPDDVTAETVPDDAATQTATAKKKASGDDAEAADDSPTFYYVFFYGEYVPYYKGWFYYSDRWLWGRRLPPPPGPPDWIPPPPPPFRPDDPIRPGPFIFPEIIGRSGSVSTGGRSGVTTSSRVQEIVRPIIPGIPIAPDAHRIPSRSGLQINSPAKSDPIPVSPDAHRIPRRRDR